MRHIKLAFIYLSFENGTRNDVSPRTRPCRCTHSLHRYFYEQTKEKAFQIIDHFCSHIINLSTKLRRMQIASLDFMTTASDRAVAAAGFWPSSIQMRHAFHKQFFGLVIYVLFRFVITVISFCDISTKLHTVANVHSLKIVMKMSSHSRQACASESNNNKEKKEIEMT